MKTHDLPRLAAILAGATELYDSRSLSQAQIRLYLDALDNYSTEQITWAVRQHIRDPERGQWFPKPADLIRVLGERLPEIKPFAALAPPPSVATRAGWPRGRFEALVAACASRQAQAGPGWYRDQMTKVDRDQRCEIDAMLDSIDTDGEFRKLGTPQT